MQIANFSLLLLLPPTSFNKKFLSYQKILISCRIIPIFLNPTYKPEGATCWFNLQKWKRKDSAVQKSRERPETLSPRNDLQNAIPSSCGQSPLQEVRQHWINPRGSELKRKISRGDLQKECMRNFSLGSTIVCPRAIANVCPKPLGIRHCTELIPCDDALSHETLVTSRKQTEVWFKIHKSVSSA